MSYEHPSSCSGKLIKWEPGPFQSLIGHFHHDALLWVYSIDVVFGETEKACVEPGDVLSQEVGAFGRACTAPLVR
jgi:hypothetical protein